MARRQLVAACATLAEATRAIAENAIDLLITDLNLPDGHGVQAIRLLREAQPDAEAMVISVLADDRTVIEAIEAGATGYLLKDSDPIDIIEAISELLAGRSPISSAIARTIVRRLGGRQAPSEPMPRATDGQPLTPREMDILWGIAKGFTYGELAERLQDLQADGAGAHQEHLSQAAGQQSLRGRLRGLAPGPDPAVKCRPRRGCGDRLDCAGARHAGDRRRSRSGTPAAAHRRSSSIARPCCPATVPAGSVALPHVIFPGGGNPLSVRYVVTIDAPAST